MSLCISDIHGNYKKLETFINYKPEEEHIHIGDLLDSYLASDADIYDTFKLAIEKNVVCLFGNHELPYLPNANAYFRCSGNRVNPIFYQLMSLHKDKFHASLIRDGYILTHGGISTKHGTPFNKIEDINEWINNDMKSYTTSPIIPTTLSSIFDIGSIRGGYEKISGIYWLTFGHESYDIRFNQICGHTSSDSIKIVTNDKHNTKHICVDTMMYHCYNTKTHEMEDFFPPEYNDIRTSLERKF